MELDANVRIENDVGIIGIAMELLYAKLSIGNWKLFLTFVRNYSIANDSH